MAAATIPLTGDQTLIGLFLGAAIHETAQVAGAGFIYDQLFDAPLALEVPLPNLCET